VKPSWEESPPNANYLAQDEDGSWHWYITMPQLPRICDWAYYCWHGKLASWFVAGKDKMNPDWKNSLEARPGKGARDA